MSTRTGTGLSKIALLAALACAACGGGGAREGNAAATDSVHVALLTAGPVSDAGWYAGGYDGLLMVRDSLPAAVSNQETRTPAEYDEAFRAYAGQKYGLVFAHGFEYQDAALRAGQSYPDMKIVVSGGDTVTANVIPLLFSLEDAAYLAGIAAAGMTKTGVLGMVGGVQIPSAEDVFVAFDAGAKSIKPDVRVIETWIGNWDDVSAAKEAAVAQIRQGADVVIHDTDAASFGVFQAVREAVAAGDTVWAMGMNNDQNQIAPEVTLGSAVIRIPQAFLEVARLWRAGQLGGKPVFSGMGEGVVDYVANPAVAARVPQDLTDRIDRARRAILAGELEVSSSTSIRGAPAGG